MQYVAGDSVVVLAYRPTTSWGRGNDPLPLAGLDPASSYVDDDGTAHPGGALLTLGLPLNLPPGDYASTCVRLVRTR
jgi:alpha-galactosidase